MRTAAPAGSNAVRPGASPPVLTRRSARCYTGAEEGSREASGLDLLDTVRQAVVRHRLIRRGERVLVAVSGGPDSVALLHLLLRLRGELSLELCVFHMDHGLRADAADDAAFVCSLAKEWGVPAVVAREDVAAMRRRGESTQEAARRVRYTAMRRAAREVGATRIALGHHADDQAETVLMRFLRGAGATGLGGMRRRQGPFVRPLLDISRADVEEYCRAFGLMTRQDPTNLQLGYLRNRLRLELLPLLEAEYNPNIRLTLNRTAALLQDDDDLLDYLAHRAFRRLQRGADGESVALPVAELARQPRALRRRIVRHAWRSVAGRAVVRDLDDGSWTPSLLSFEHVEAVLALLDSRPGEAVDLPARVRARRDEEVVTLRRIEDSREAAPDQEDFAVPLAVPGTTVVPGICVIEARLVEEPHKAQRPGRDGAWLDWEKLAPPLVARTWRPGDRMRPLGLGGTKKLQDLFVDEKVPAAQRRRVPVVVDQHGIVWTAGLRVDERAAAGPASRRILQLKVAPL